MSYPVFRRVLQWTHLAMGLAAGLYAVLIGITGSLLVFRQEWEALEYPELHSRATLKSPLAAGAPPSAMLEGIGRDHWGWRAISITFPNDGTPYWMTYLLKGRAAKEVYFDPMTGREVAAVDPKGGWSGWLAALHANLLLGRTGSLMNGYGACTLLLLCASGLVLWMPSSRARWWQQARSRLRIEFPGSPRRVFWQAHHAVGLVSLVFITLLSITGTYFIWSQSYVGAVGRWFPRTSEPMVPVHPAGSPLLAPETVANLAQRAAPGLPIHRLQIVDNARQPVRVTLRHGSPAEFHLVSTLFLDPVDGAVLKRDALSTRPSGDRILAWFSALHFGVFGGWPIRMAWFLFGLSLPVMAISGAALRWLRASALPKQPDKERAAQ